MTQQLEDELRQEFIENFEEQSRRIGRFNLAIYGKTGVGKSTLINAIFGEEVAATGIGAPVTQGSHLHRHVNGHFGVFDTRGLEIGKDSDTIQKELEQTVQELRQKPLLEQIHVVWYCVRAADRRFEETEAEFIGKLHELKLPVLLVFTQVPMRDGQYHPDALELRDTIGDRDLPLNGEPVFLTYAKADKFAGYEPHGLQDLLDATFRVAPQAVAEALTVAQQIDMDRKRAAAHKAIGVAVTAAGAAGATPIPFSDAVVLVPIQLAMMARICHIYDIEVDKATTATLAATAAATAAGRSLATGLIKLVPGFGSVVGGAIAAGVASGITWAMGQAWMVVCTRIFRGELSLVSGALDNDQIRKVFMEEFKSKVRKRLPGGSSESGRRAERPAPAQDAEVPAGSS